MEHFAATLLVPIILVLCGLLMWIAGKPKRYSWFVGYRMPRACINQETWVFANRYFGKLAMLGGCTALTFSIGAFIHQELMLWSSGASGVAFVLTWVFTEIALRREFDKNGNRRK